MPDLIVLVACHLLNLCPVVAAGYSITAPPKKVMTGADAASAKAEIEWYFQDWRRLDALEDMARGGHLLGKGECCSWNNPPATRWDVQGFLWVSRCRWYGRPIYGF